MEKDKTDISKNGMHPTEYNIFPSADLLDRMTWVEVKVDNLSQLLMPLQVLPQISETLKQQHSDAKRGHEDMLEMLKGTMEGKKHLTILTFCSILALVVVMVVVVAGKEIHIDRKQIEIRGER